MRRFFFATLILLSSGIGTAWAYRVIEQTEDSYELALAEVSLPRGQPGFVRFRMCNDCETISLLLTSSTTYYVNGALSEFPEFFAAAAAFREMEGRGNSTAVYVFLDTESRQVKRLVLDHFGE